MNKLLIAIIVLVVVGILLAFLLPSQSVAPEKASQPADTILAVPAPGSEGVSETVVRSGNAVTILDSGFDPKTLRIKKGEIVIWVNESSRGSWPASAFHPSHTIYPEKGGCISSAFDACRGLQSGEEFNFEFNQTGSWNYHDHLAPSRTGTIIVE